MAAPLSLSSVLLLACSHGAAQQKPASPADTGSDSAVDTSSQPPDTSDTGPVQGWRSLALAPSAITVDAGATWTFRATARDAAGEVEDVTPTWTASDPSVIQVDDSGLATALAAGGATVTASLEGLEATASVTVQDDGRMVVRVVRASDGQPVAGAKVRVEGAVSTVDDATGQATVQVQPGVPVWVMAYGPQDAGLVSATLLQVVDRDLAIPLRSGSDTGAGSAALGGQVDFSGVIPVTGGEKGSGLVVVGLAVPSLQDGALFFDASDLMAGDRTVTFMGIDIVLPGNFFVEDLVEDWQASARPGPVGVWAAAGPIPVDDLLSVSPDEASIADLLIPHMDGFAYTWQDGIQAETGQAAQVDLAPDTALSDSFTVRLAPLPDGFQGTEQALVLALYDAGAAGPAVAGMGRGSLDFTVPRVPASAYGFGDDGMALAYAEVGGFGAGGARVLTQAPVQDGVAEPPPWMTPPELSSFSGATHELQLQADPRAAVVRLNLSDPHGEQRDVYVPGGAGSYTLPTEGPAMSYGRTHWRLAAVETASATYESLLAEGALAQSSLSAMARTTGLLERDFSGD